MKSIDDPILKILASRKALSFQAIHQQTPLTKRTLQRRLNILEKEGKIKRYRRLDDTRKFHFALAGD